MNERTVNTEIEKQKMELIKLRIKNKFYERDEVFEKVAEELLNREIKLKN